MAESKGTHSYDTALYAVAYGTPVPANLASIVSGWVEISDVISINGIPLTRTVTNITHLRSPDKFMEKIPGFGDGGQLTFSLNYYKNLMTILEQYCPGGVNAPDTSPAYGRVRWALVLPDHGVWTFKAFIQSKPIEVPEDNKTTIQAALEISGKPVWLQFA